MELNEYWSAHAVEEYKGMLYEQKMQNYAYNCLRSAPHVIYKPIIVQDGDAWLCMYGDLPTGVIGCGSTPKEACENFDRTWEDGYKKLDCKGRSDGRTE